MSRFAQSIYSEQEISLVRSICNESFYEFTREFWPIIISEKPVWNWHIEYLCNEMQEVAERVFRGEKKKYDLLINISPGTTKSTICSRMFPAWVWTRMPSAKILAASYAHSLMESMALHSRDIIRSDIYRAAFPEVMIRGDMDTKGHYGTTAQGLRRTVGTGGAVTGFHGHFILIDDPIDPGTANSDGQLQKAIRWLRETIPTRMVDKEVTPQIMIMQRLHQKDPAGYWLEMKKNGERIKHICLPAEDCDKVQPAEVRDRYKDGLMDPIRLSKAVLEGYKRRLGSYGYACQFEQSPIPREGGMFKTHRIEIDTPHLGIKNKVRYWDKAGTSGGGAYTVGLLMGMDPNKRFWILDVVRGQWSSEEREEIIRSTAVLDGVETLIGVEQEPGSGGKESAEATVRRLAGFRVRVDIPTGDKVLRADPYSVQVNSGNVSVKKADWNGEYLKELEFFPHSTYKDQVDASSGAFALLTKPRVILGATR